MRAEIRRLGIRAAFVALGCALLAGTTSVAWASPANHHRPTVDYVALGDSYSAGVGAPATGACQQSPLGYPQLWVNSHRVSSFTNVTCSGATTDTLLASQIGSLQPGTDLVTLTIGGNDAGFSTTVGACVAGTAQQCTAAVTAGTTFAEKVLPAKLDTVYRQIRARSPRAKVVVLGYPHLYSTGPCTTGPSVANRRTLNSGADRLDTVIARRAYAAGFRYADVRFRFATHGACARVPWINDQFTTVPGGAFHPTADGYRLGYLPALRSVTG
jgi:lysophospholipase L1-like esterase